MPPQVPTPERRPDRFCLWAPLSQCRHRCRPRNAGRIDSVSGHHFLNAATGADPGTPAGSILSLGTTFSMPPQVPTPERRPDRFCLWAPLSQCRHRCRPRNAGRIDSVSGHHFLNAATGADPGTPAGSILSLGTTFSMPPQVPTPERRPDRFCLWAPLSQCRQRCRPRNAGRIDSVSGHHFLNAATGADPGTPAGSILSLGTTFSMPPQVPTPERAIRSLARILHYIKLQRELYDDQGTRW